MVRVFILTCVLALSVATTSSAQGFIGIGFGNSGFGSGYGPGSFGYGGFGPSLGYGGFGPSYYGSGIALSIGGNGYRGRSNYGYAPRVVYTSNYRSAPVYRATSAYRPSYRSQNACCNCRRY